MSMLVLYIAKHVCCLSVRLSIKLKWAEEGGASVETMAGKDWFGVQ